MDIFKTLTVGVSFDKNKIKRKPLKEVKKSEPEDEIAYEPETKKKSVECQNEKINSIRKQHHINVKGESQKEKPIESFAELFTKFSIDETLKANLAKFNYEKLTPVQMQVIPLILKKHQVKACAPTGSGKTMAFLIPLIQRLIDEGTASNTEDIRVIILSPTRELAQQILSCSSQLCHGTKVRSHLITSTNETHMKNFHKKKTNILISTPLKLVHLIKDGRVSLKNVEYVVMDEVDKFFEESNQTFNKDLEVILNECTNKAKKFQLFSATNTKEMTGWVHEKLLASGGFITVNIQPNTPVSSVDQELRFVGTESAKLMELRDIIRNGIQPPILIFVQSKDRAQQLFSELICDGLNIDIMHSDKSSKERNESYRKFREGRTWILICTDLMARGMDFRNVSLVINYDLPTSLISYVHKVGRVGRAGRTGKAITFYTKDDNNCGLLRDMARMVKASGSHVEPYLLQLKKSTKKERDALLKKAPKRKSISKSISSKSKRIKKRKIVKKLN